MYCPLGHHVLRGPGEFITNPRHIRFINKMFPDFLPSEKVCAKCKQDVANAYKYKMNRALAIKAQNASLISSYSTEESIGEENRNKEKSVNSRNVQRQMDASSTTSTTDDDGDGQPSTSAQAAAKRKRLEERQKQKEQQNPLAINVQRGARLPHIQPVARRQRFVHANPDIMDIYLRGTTGG